MAGLSQYFKVELCTKSDSNALLFVNFKMMFLISLGMKNMVFWCWFEFL